MRLLTTLGAIGTLLIASSSAAPFSFSNATVPRKENSTITVRNATYFHTNDAQWVSDTQLCGNASREHSGYINVGNHTENEKLNMAFWLFEGSEYREHLPLYIILGGEHGVPVTQAVFGPTGPCSSNLYWVPDETSDNGEVNYFEQGQHGFQRWANTLYIETPIGLGFSYAEGNATADQPEEEYLYIFLQRFFDVFPHFEERRVLIQSFDLGAKVATKFTKTIVEHNQAIAEGEEQGKPIDLDSLILLSPYLDPAMQITYTRKISRHNADGEPWMSKEGARIFKQDYAQWKAECLGRDYKIEDLRNPEEEFASCNETQRMHRFRTLWHGMMEGYDNEEVRYPDIDPFDLREIRQDRMSEFLYHRYTRPFLEAWLQDRSNQRRLGFASFADAGLDYAAFNRPMVDDMLNTTFFDKAPKGLDKAVENGVQVVFVGGDMDAVTNWISLLKLAYQIDGIREFMDANLKPFDDIMTEQDTYPEHPTHLGDANLKNRLWIKAGGKLQYIMIKNAGHDIEKQEPALWNDLAMYITWPQPSKELVRSALDYPPGYEPLEDPLEPSQVDWPADLPYVEHEPHAVGEFHKEKQVRNHLSKRRNAPPGDSFSEQYRQELRRLLREHEVSEADSIPDEGPLEQLYQEALTVAELEDLVETQLVIEGPEILEAATPPSRHSSDFPDFYDEDAGDVGFISESQDDSIDGSFRNEAQRHGGDSPEPAARESSFEESPLDSPSVDAPSIEAVQANPVQDWMDDIRNAAEQRAGKTAPFDAEAELHKIMQDYRNPNTGAAPDSRTLQEFLEDYAELDSSPLESGEAYDEDFASIEDYKEQPYPINRPDPGPAGEEGDSEYYEEPDPEDWESYEHEYEVGEVRQNYNPKDSESYEYESEEYYEEPDSQESIDKWLDEFTKEQNFDEWADLREAAHKALSEMGYQKLGGNSFQSEYVDGLMRPNQPSTDESDLDIEDTKEIEDWIDDANAEVPDVPEVGTPESADSLLEVEAPNLPGVSLPNVPLQAAGSSAGKAVASTAGKYLAGGAAAGAAAGVAAGGVASGVGEVAGAAGSTAGVAGGVAGGTASAAGSVAGGIAGGIGSGIGGLFGGGDDDDDHHHDDDKSDDDHKDGDDDGKDDEKKDDDKKNDGKKDDKDSFDDPKMDSKPESEKKEKSNSKSKPESEPEDQSEAQVASETEPEPEPEVVEGDEDGDGDTDEADEELRKQAKENFEAKAEEIKDKAHKEDDEAKDAWDEAEEKAKSARKKLKEAEKEDKKASEVVPDAEDDSKDAFKGAKKKAKGARKSVNKALKKIQEAAEAEAEAAEAIEKAMEGAVSEAGLAQNELDVAQSVEKELKQEAKEASDNLVKAEQAKTYADLNADVAEKIAEEKDAWDDALSKGHISMEDAVAAVEAAERQAVEDLARQKAIAEEQLKSNQGVDGVVPQQPAQPLQVPTQA